MTYLNDISSIGARVRALDTDPIGKSKMRALRYICSQLFSTFLLAGLSVNFAFAGLGCSESEIKNREPLLVHIFATATKGLELKAANNSQAALPLVKEAYALAAANLPENDPGRFAVLQALGPVLEDNGNYGEALSAYQDGLKNLNSAQQEVCGTYSLTGLEAEKIKALLHNNLANLLMNMNRFEEAGPNWLEAIRIRQRIAPESEILAITMINYAVFLNRTKNYAKATEIIRGAKPILVRVAPNSEAYARALNTECFTLNNLSPARPNEALPLCLQAIEMDEALSDGTSANFPSFLSNLAESYRRINDSQKQGEALVKALVLAQRSSRPELTWIASSNLATYLQQQGRSDEAIALGKYSIEQAEIMRRSLASHGNAVQRSFLQDKYRNYRVVADWLMDAGRITEALEVLDLLRDQEASDFIQRASKAPSRLPAKSKDEEAFIAQFSTLADVLAKSERRLGELRRADRLNGIDPGQARELAELEKRIVPLRQQTLKHVLAWQSLNRGRREQTIVAAYEPPHPDSAYLGYLISEGSTWAYWNDGRGMKTLKLDVDARWVTNRLEILTNNLKNTDQYIKPVLQELYDGLFKPLDGKIAARHIYLSGVDDIRYIPFAALHDGKDYLVRRYSFSQFLPKRSKAKSGNERLLGFGLTKASMDQKALPGVSDELCAVVRGPIHGLPGKCAIPVGGNGIIPGEAYVDQQFTVDRLSNALSGAGESRFVHVATHFKLGAVDTESLLYLDGKSLSLDQLRSIEMHAVNLLVLSACDTARVPGGSQFQGFARFAADRGADAVLATLWPVADASTPKLMARFYAGAANNLDKADALRQAQLALLDGSAGNNFRHPKYWAAFVLFSGF